MTTRSLSSTLISCYELTTYIQQFSIDESIECPFIVEELQTNLAVHITDFLSQENWLLDSEERQVIPFFKKLIKD